MAKERVNASIAHIDEVTQRIASMVDEAASQAKPSQAQATYTKADNLSRAINVSRLCEHDGVSAEVLY